MNRSDLTERLRDKAIQLGFCSVGFCAAAEPAGFGRLQAWLDAGYAGQLHYMADRREAYRHPRHVLDGARSLVVLGTDYRNAEPEVARKACGWLRYAWGADYHEVIHRRLCALADYHRQLWPERPSAAWSIRRRCWSARRRFSPGWDGSAETRSC